MKFNDILLAEPLKNKVICRRFGKSRRYEERDIIKLCNFINDKLRGLIINKFQDKTNKECIVFYKEDLINLFEEAFFDIKKSIETTSKVEYEKGGTHNERKTNIIQR